MAEEAKIEFSTRDAVLAVGFIAIVMVSITLSMAGVITSPLTLGLLITLTIVLLFIGQILVKSKVISKSALPLWYSFVLGFVLLMYGMIQAGYIPVAFVMPGATVMETAITNSMFYVILILSVLAAIAVIYAGYQYYRRKAAVAVYH